MDDLSTGIGIVVALVFVFFLGFYFSKSEIAADCKIANVFTHTGSVYDCTKREEK